MAKKIYLAGGISDIARKKYQADLAERIESLGYEVYAAARNDSINDKSNNPTPLDIYEGDIDRVKECDIFVMTVSGAGEDGTISELGMVAGWNELADKKIEVIAFCTNERLLTPQFYKGEREDITGLASAGYNHLVLGMIDRWGKLVGTEEDLMRELVD